MTLTSTAPPATCSNCLLKCRQPEGQRRVCSCRYPARVADPRLVSVQDFTVHADHGQMYVQAHASVPPKDWDDDEVQLTALYEAWASARFVGVRPGFIDVLTPGQWNYQTPLRVEVWSGEPPDDRDGWDHEVDADLDVPDGLVSIVGPPSGERAVSATMAPGGYRVRISGRGFGQLGAAGANGEDSYRLRFWPRDRRQVPVLRKRWPGWDAYRLPDPSTYPSPYHEAITGADDET
jgi:hypothetical protein